MAMSGKWPEKNLNKRTTDYMEKQQKLQIFAVFCCVASFCLYKVKKSGHRKKIGRAVKNRTGSGRGASGAPGF